MARIASALLVVGLLVGTAVAFGITERFKLVRSPITSTRVDSVFSPVCGCRTDEARIAFRLREGDRVTLSLIDGSGDVVRTLLSGEPTAAGLVEAGWDGRDETGEVVPEGSYQPRVKLAEERRTIVLPNPIRVDTTPPRVTLVSVQPKAFSPDGDGRRERINVAYEVSEPAHALLFVDGEQRVRGRWQRPEGRLAWFGRLGGRELPAGHYRVSLAAADRAGNVSRRSEATAVEIRYIELGRDVVRVRARSRFGVQVVTDAAKFRWRFAGGTRTAEPGLLVLRAPKAGRYRLFVEVNGHAARATVIVRPRGR